MSGAALPLLIAAVIAGGATQRVSGMGMGLVLSPVLALLLGPALGVTVTNCVTLTSALLIGYAMRTNIDWKAFAVIAPAAVAGSIPGALIVRSTPGPWLSVLIGAIILAALAITLWADRSRRLGRLTGRLWLVPFAAGGALLNAVSGVAAPIFIIYAVASRWDQRSFSATLQPAFAWIGFLSVASKTLIGATPALPTLWIAPIIIAAIIAGIALGTLLSRRVSTQFARRIAVAAAGLGAVSTLLRGLADALG